MSRSGGGGYSIPNTFIEDTDISPDEVNQNFDDLGDEIANSLALDGQSSMTGQVKGAAGTLALPGYSWANETNSGWYRAGAGDFRYSVAGADVFKITSAGVEVIGTITGTVTIANSSVTNAKLANMAANTLKANLSDSSAVPTDRTLTEVLDDLAGSSQGSLLYRGASAWTALAPGTSGQYLKTQGAAANPAWADVTVPAVASVSVAEVATMSTATTTIPLDDTIPQITEGTEVITISVTTTTASQKVRLKYEGEAAVSAQTTLIVALFVDSTANALAAIPIFVATNSANGSVYLSLDKTVSPGAAGTYTYRIRVGPNSAATVTFNGGSTVRTLGGAQSQRLVAEVLA